jgi:hypothetical protein
VFSSDADLPADVGLRLLPLLAGQQLRRHLRLAVPELECRLSYIAAHTGRRLYVAKQFRLYLLHVAGGERGL